VVLITALRTPFARFKGGFKDTYPEELLAKILEATRKKLESQGLDVSQGVVEDIKVGTVLMELGGAKSGRLAALHAGFPYKTGFNTVNRQCSSSLQAITDISQSIQTRTIDFGIAAGVESMTKNYGTRAIPKDISPEMAASPNQDARDCLMPMGLTSENVAAEYNVSRERQDKFAAASQAKATKATKEGLYDEEIVPTTVQWIDDKGDGLRKEKTIKADEGIRPQSTFESLQKLKPAFKEDGTSTAGNSSQISDGASAVTLVRRSVAEKLGLKPIGRFIGTSVVGVPPRIMGVGPAFAVPHLLNKYGLSVDEIDLFELNEAFASQALMTMDTLKIPEEKVNPKGGAIAIGHPLGATGGRLVSSLITELRRTGKEVGIATLCCGTGLGKASLFVAEHD